MKRVTILIAAAMFLPMAGILAQPLVRGYFASAGVVLGAYDNGAFSRRLQSYRPLAPNGEPAVYQTNPFPNNGVGFTVNAATLLYSRFVVGASFQFLSYQTVYSIGGPGVPRDEYSLSGNGVGIDLGYAVLNTEGALIYPLAHLGLYSHTLSFTNNQSAPASFFESAPVAPGATQSYDGSGPVVGLGVGFVKTLGGGSGSSGMTVNARLDLTRMLGSPAWKDGGNTVPNGGNTPCHCGASLTVSVGGLLGER